MDESPRLLSTLNLYEKAAAEQREAMRIGILPASFPANYFWFSPEACFSRAENPSCRYFDGHEVVVLSPLDDVLARLGTSALVDKLAELTEVARTQLNATIKDAVLANLIKESIPSSKPADRVIDDRYWLSRLEGVWAAVKPAAGCSPLAADYFPIPAEPLPAQEQRGYNKIWKCDACLRPSAAKLATISNIFINVEFTEADAPNVAYNPLIGPSDRIAKYQQAIVNADDLLTFQPTRLFGLSTEKARIQLSLSPFSARSALSLPSLTIAFIRTLSSPSRLSCTSSALPRYIKLALILSSPIIFPLLPPTSLLATLYLLLLCFMVLRLNGKRLPHLRSTPFGRTTLALEGELEEQPWASKGPTPTVVNVCFIARPWQEKIVVDALHTADLETSPTYAPKLLAAFAAHSTPLVGMPNASKVLQAGDQLESALDDPPTRVPHHHEVMAFASPHNARPLKDLEEHIDSRLDVIVW
ncbi:hypothetical protein DXG03_004322 [Asterophora parasitica]|uniref:Uncharacterized protein n=1 Tax=Asterophora parasitica TaxID=117018 RepID=A0A9P7KBE2_9AGAR|nr:hypothetical protein DXG03_004322 [Asterophora parasitica]